jgi:hypothetical protein
MPPHLPVMTIWKDDREVLYIGKWRCTKSLRLPQLASKLLEYITMERIFQPLATEFVSAIALRVSLQRLRDQTDPLACEGTSGSPLESR